MFPAKQDQTSKNAIYIALRRSIIMGHRKPGERFEVEAIARQYNTSVTPVRDVLQMLGHEGLVDIKQRSGYFVTHTTLKQLRDLFDLRRVLEIAAIEWAAVRVQDDQIAELTKVHAGYTGDDDEAYDRYTDENRYFHYLLARASGNNELAETVSRLHDRLARFMVLRHAGKTMELSHRKIVDALKAHDVETARRALLDDIDDTYDLIMDKVIQEESETWSVGG
jgi:DNA-binding GntR family transcriptional regulator